MSDSETPKPNRRWCQFRLRTLMGPVALVSIGLKWLGMKLQETRKQRATAAALTGRGAALLILGCFAFLHVVGCASEEVPDTAVAVFTCDDLEAQSRGQEVLRENHIEMACGFFLGDDSQPASYMIFVKKHDQARAAALVAADAKEKDYSVTVHSAGRAETIHSEKSHSMDQATEAEPDEESTVANIRQARLLEKEISADLGGGVKMELVLIPAGEFMMGNTHTVKEELALCEKYGRKAPAAWFEGEHPLHRVRITKAFYLGKYEVTVRQYRQFVNATGHKTKWEDYSALGERPENWRNPGFAQTDEHPVVRVDWNDANAFCTWLSHKAGKTHCLPTEAQWEYACRAGTTTRYWSGDDPETLVEVGNVPDAAAKACDPSTSFAIRGNDGYAFTAPVGKFRPNAFGLYDMHGNVWEWCADWYDYAYYAKSPKDDPKGPRVGRCRVLRGGAWDNIAGFCSSAHRECFDPDRYPNHLGFRVSQALVDR